MPTPAAPPTKIMIIRHAEKPPKKGLPLDVQENGEPGNGKSLIVPGWQRAGALNAFFAPYKTTPANPHIAPGLYLRRQSHQGVPASVGDGDSAGGLAQIRARHFAIQCHL